MDQFKWTSRHLNAVLAALRSWQASHGVGRYGALSTLNRIATNDGTEAPLTNDEIDELCEALNTAEHISIDIGAPAKRLLRLYELRDAARDAMAYGLVIAGKNGTGRLRDALIGCGVSFRDPPPQLKHDHNRSVHLIYPEKRAVPGSVIMGWAADRFADGDIETEPKTLADAIFALEDAGLITVKK